jgi:hypothetical protein
MGKANPKQGTSQEVTKASMFQSHEDFLRRRTKRLERPQITAEDINNLNATNLEEERLEIFNHEIKRLDT